MTWFCKKCQRDLPTEAFYPSTNYICKECHKREARKRCRANHEKEYLRSKLYNKKNKERKNAIRKAWNIAHAQQVKAGWALRQAVKRGNTE